MTRKMGMRPSTRELATGPHYAYVTNTPIQKTVDILHSYVGSLRYGENSALGLFESFRLLRDSDIAIYNAIVKRFHVTPCEVSCNCQIQAMH